MKTPNELKNNNSGNAAELLDLLLRTKRDAFLFPMDDKKLKECNDGSSNNPIIDLVVDKKDKEMSTENTNKQPEGKNHHPKAKLRMTVTQIKNCMGKNNQPKAILRTMLTQKKNHT